MPKPDTPILDLVQAAKTERHTQKLGEMAEWLQHCDSRFRAGLVSDAITSRAKWWIEVRSVVSQMMSDDPLDDTSITESQRDEMMKFRDWFDMQMESIRCGPVEMILYSYLGIDWDAAESERQLLLDWVQEGCP